MPRYATEQTMYIKQSQDNIKLLPTYMRTSKANLQPTCFPPVSTKEASTGRRTGLDNVVESQYYFRETGESLPRYDTAQTRRIKQSQEHIKLQRTNKRNRKADLQLTNLPPISPNEGEMGGRCPPLDDVVEPQYCCREMGEPLPRYDTVQPRHIKRSQEHIRLQPTYKTNRKANLQPTHLPPISTKEAAAG